jgi:hypothetical protein
MRAPLRSGRPLSERAKGGSSGAKPKPRELRRMLSPPLMSDKQKDAKLCQLFHPII